MMQRIIIVDCGSQYTQLIARKVRESRTYCEVIAPQQITTLDQDVIGLILSGSSLSATSVDIPQINLEELSQRVPILGICYGAQYIAQYYGGQISKSKNREFGKAQLYIDSSIETMLLQDIPHDTAVWMSHGDTITQVPETFEVIAQSSGIAVFQREKGNNSYPIYGVQFHPEVSHSDYGKKILQNFIYSVCKSKKEWTTHSFIKTAVAEVKSIVKQEHVLMALSGGVDSSVAATLIHKAIGDKFHGIFVNNGLLRKNEYNNVLEAYNDMQMNVQGIDASTLFYNELQSVKDPEKKRKIIGRLFIEVFEKAAQKINHIAYLGQGTTYPDIIESISLHGPSVTIKSHHNVGGLPSNMSLKLIEPIKTLFKDEVREVGRALGIPDKIIRRHPFPGPGLAIRIIGDVTPQKVKTLQDVDDIFIHTLKKYEWYDQVWQAGAILLPIQSVGVMGDQRTYENVVALRAVSSVDGMTADWSRLPYELLAELSNQITNQVPEVNRVVYDVSSKPPSTIEWE